MDIRRVRRRFLLLVVTSLLAVILLIRSGYRFPTVDDHALLISWEKTPSNSQQEVRRVKQQAWDRIPDHTRPAVASKHPHYQKHLNQQDVEYTKNHLITNKPGFSIQSSDSIASELTGKNLSSIWKEQLEIRQKNFVHDDHTIENHQITLPENARNHREDNENDDKQGQTWNEIRKGIFHVNGPHKLYHPVLKQQMDRPFSQNIERPKGRTPNTPHSLSAAEDDSRYGETKTLPIHVPEDSTEETDSYHIYDSESSVLHSLATTSSANSNIINEFLIAQQHTEGETQQRHNGHAFTMFTLPASSPAETVKRYGADANRPSERTTRLRNPYVGRNPIDAKEAHIRKFVSKNTSPRKMFTMKEDVVMEPMPKYTNMKPVSESEFLQLKADGILRRNISRYLFNMAPEVFLKTPLTFSQQTRGPCWFVKDNGAPPMRRMRCLPYFYVMGMPKCGTTDLYAKITWHPSVVFLHKEPHWWTRTRFGKGIKGSNEKVSYDAYLHHYYDVINTIFKTGHPEIMVGGDGSASTMWHGSNFLGLNDLTDFPALPKIIHEIQPEVKLIAMLREPVQRVYSDYMYFHHKKVDAEDFHRLVRIGINKFTRCTRMGSPRQCAARGVSAQGARVTLGLYSVFLLDWLKVFPRDQILILRLRDWNTDCLTLLPKVYEFLELETLPDKTIRTLCNSSAHNVNPKKKFPMLNTTAEILTDFYRPYTEDLAAMLQDDRFLWMD